jgi:hypothetical protein
MNESNNPKNNSFLLLWFHVKKFGIDIHILKECQRLVLVDRFPLAMMIFPIDRCFVQIGNQMTQHKGMILDDFGTNLHVRVGDSVGFQGKIEPLSQIGGWFHQEGIRTRQKSSRDPVFPNDEFPQSVALTVVKNVWQVIVGDTSRSANVFSGIEVEHVPSFDSGTPDIRYHEALSDLMG